MFRKMGTLWASLGIAMALGLFLVIGLDFISQLGTPVVGFSDVLVAMNYFGYFVASLFGIVIIILPIDFYWSIQRDPVIIVLELFLFFGLIGAWMGFRSSAEDVKHPIIEAFFMPYILVLVVNVVLVIIIYITYPWMIGLLLRSLVEGTSGRSIWFFVLMSTIENGTFIALFAVFVSVLMGDKKEGDGMFCKDGSVCDV